MLRTVIISTILAFFFFFLTIPKQSMWLDERFNICEFTYSSFTYFHVEALPVPRQMLTGCLLGKGETWKVPAST